MKRFEHSLRHAVATHGFIGTMTPFLKMEVAPGDTFNGKISTLIRFSQLAKPCLTPFYVNQYIFYVPHRLVWEGWESFLASGPDPDDPPETPGVSVPDIDLLPVADFWEVQTKQWQGFRMRAGYGQADDAKYYNALPVRAYNLVYNEYFRDEEWSLVSPDDWQTPAFWNGHPVGQTKQYWTELQERIGYPTNHEVPVVNEAVDATEILRAIAKQKLAMKRATYGTRYVDILRGYGISVNYQMLQRPELVAMSRSTINVTDVVSSNADLTDQEFQSEIAGHGIGGNSLRIRRKMFPEHGTLLGINVIRPIEQTTYCDWFDSRRRFESYYDPGCLVLPPQPVTIDCRYGSNYDGDPSYSPESVVGRLPWGHWYRSHPSWSGVTRPDWQGADQRMENYGWTAYAPASGPLQQQWSRINPGGYNKLFTNAIVDEGQKIPGVNRRNAPAAGHYQAAFQNSLTALRLIPKNSPAVFNGST